MVDNQTYGDTLFLLKINHTVTAWSLAHILWNSLYVSADGSWEGILWEDQSYMCIVWIFIYDTYNG